MKHQFGHQIMRSSTNKDQNIELQVDMVNLWENLFLHYYGNFTKKTIIWADRTIIIYIYYIIYFSNK